MSLSWLLAQIFHMSYFIGILKKTYNDEEDLRMLELNKVKVKENDRPLAPDDKSSPKEVERVSYWLSALRRAASKAIIIISDLGVSRFIFL